MFSLLPLVNTNPNSEIIYIPIRFPINLKFCIIFVICNLLSVVFILLKLPGAKISNITPIPNNKILKII